MSPHIWTRISSRAGGQATATATYRHRRIHSDDIALLNQKLARLVAELADLILGDGPAGAQLLDGLVEVAAAYAHLGGGLCLAVWPLDLCSPFS